MEQHVAEKISESPAFRELSRRRSRLGWTLSIAMLLVYYPFIVVLGFWPEILSRRISEDSVITWGIPAGLAIIVFAIAITGFYVFRANRIFDPLTKEILGELED